LHIIIQNWRLDNLISSQLNCPKLNRALELVKLRQTTGSLIAYDGFDFAELHRFAQIFRYNLDDTITGNELFPEKMLTPRKCGISLPTHIYELLV
jgi:hypothetical protein